MNQDHDSSYKHLFSMPEMVRDLVLGFIPDHWLQSLDFSTLEKVSGSYVSEDFTQRESDIVWRVKVADDWIYLYLLIEFQSRIDKYMALRMMVYIGLLYQDLIKEGHVPSGNPLPPVLPIVLYNGSQKWTAATNIADLIPSVPGLVDHYKPSLRYLLIDENNYSDSQLASLDNLVAAVFRLEHAASPQAVSELTQRLADWLHDRPDLRKLFATWLRATLMRKPEYAIVMPQVDDLQEIRVMLADKIEEWAKAYIAEGEMKGIQRGRQEGRQEGRYEGEILALQKLLAKRFGAIPIEITALISEASLLQVEAWFDKAIDAESLAAVFENPFE